MNQHMNKDYSLPSVHSRDLSSRSLITKSRTNILSRIGHQQRKWFKKRGKTQSIMFTSQMLTQLRKYFNDLDADLSGAIGLDELQEPLITLEFCQSRQEVKNLIQTIDLDRSGEIQFAEFLQIFRKVKLNKYASPKQAQKYHTFMEIFSEKTSNKLGKDQNFRLAISELRRKKIIGQLTNMQKIRPRQKRYQKKRQIVPNFLKKIQNQFMQIPQLNSKMIQNKGRDYYRFKLGKS